MLPFEISQRLSRRDLTRRSRNLKFHNPSTICRETDLAQFCHPPHLVLPKMEGSCWQLRHCVSSSWCGDSALALSLLFSLHLHEAALAIPECSLLFCFCDNVDSRLPTLGLLLIFPYAVFGIRKMREGIASAQISS